GVLLRQQAGQRPLPGSGKAHRSRQRLSEPVSEGRRQQRGGHPLQGGDIAALTAEQQVLHNPGGRQRLDASGGKSFRRGHRPGQGQLQHQVRAALHGGPGPGVF
ncbi:DUF4190 domain-containing protein, partial [Dysosmobacter welbionis]